MGGVTNHDTTTAFRTCPLCEAGCGLEITLTAGRVSRIRGDAADVFSHGYICPKGVALKDLHEDPDRLRTPLIKRNGVFEQATWDEAYAAASDVNADKEIARNLQLSPRTVEAHRANLSGKLEVGSLAELIRRYGALVDGAA